MTPAIPSSAPVVRAPATTSAPSAASAVRDGQPDALARAGDDGDLAAQFEVHGAASAGVLDGPVERIVGDFLPAVLAEDVVRAPGELLQLGVGLGLALQLGLRAADRERGDVVLLAGDDQQRGAVVVVEVDLGRRVGVEVRERRLEQDAARAGDRVALVGGTGTRPRSGCW